LSHRNELRPKDALLRPIFRMLELPLVEERIAEADRMARENRRVFEPLRKISLDKKDEPFTFLLRLLEEDESSG
jgi:hypothetical protein